MDVKQQVFMRLKPKAKAFGFNKKELQGVAAKIADNLTFEEDALEEDVNASIDEKIDAVLPFLQMAQAQANRIIDASRKATMIDDDDEPIQEPSAPQTKPTNTDDEPAWFKAYRELQDKRFAALEGDRIATTRKQRLESLLKNTGTFGTHTLKSFSRMKFDSDDEFDEFFAEVEDGLKSLNQERANIGLDKLGDIPVPGKEVKKENEPFSDDEIIRMAKNV
jgi:hypothetical protein